MSVLVKDMKMPKYCLECLFEDSPEFDSYCIAIGNEFIGKWEDLGAYKPDWCPLQDAPTVGEWIPVSERLPDIGDTYLVTVMVGKEIRTDVADSFGNYIDGFWDTFNDWIEDEECHVIAWMPLPPAYQGE